MFSISKNKGWCTLKIYYACTHFWIKEKSKYIPHCGLKSTPGHTLRAGSCASVLEA